MYNNNQNPMSEEELISKIEDRLTSDPKPKRRKITVVAIMLTGILAFGLFVVTYLVQQQQETRIKAEAETVNLSLLPTTIEVQTGKDFELQIYIDTHGLSVSAVRLTLDIDSEMVEIEKSEAGEILSVKLPRNANSTDPHIVELSARCDEQTCHTYSGVGMVARLKLKALKSGETTLSINQSDTQVAVVGFGNTNKLGEVASATVTITDSPLENSPSPTDSGSPIPATETTSPEPNPSPAIPVENSKPTKESI